MSTFDLMHKQVARERDIQRKRERALKRAFEIDADLDALADFDEFEITEMRERNAAQRELF